MLDERFKLGLVPRLPKTCSLCYTFLLEILGSSRSAKQRLGPATLQSDQIWY